MLHPAHHLGHRVVAPRDPLTAGQHVVEDKAERVDVGAVIDSLALRLLGRHVLERAHDGTQRRRRAGCTHRARDAEIHDQRAAVGRDHDVLGLEIAVHDADFVGGAEARRDLLRDRERARHRQLALALQHVREVLPFDERHRQVLDAVELAQIVNADDVLVGDLAGEHELALEAPLDFAGGPGIEENFGPNDLQRDGDAKLGVPRLIHDTHAAGAKHA